MKATLHGVSGPCEGAHIPVDSAIVVTVGRNAACTLSIANDRFISDTHFEITVREDAVCLQDLHSTNGTSINGMRLYRCLLADGDVIQAGESFFQIEFNTDQPFSVIDVLSSLPEPLYAVLDGARDPAIYPLLLTSGAHSWPLYTGESARTLETVAPYLVHLPPHCPLLKDVVRKGWGNSWNVFLTSRAHPETVWHELRRSAMVILEDTGKLVYFRYYDPRVLRRFLPMTDPQQWFEFAGSISSFFVEDKDPRFMLRFQSSPSGCVSDRITVFVSGPETDRPFVAESIAATQVIRTL